MLIQAQVLAASSLTTDQIIDVVAILVPLLIAFAGGIFLIYRWRHRAERTPLAQKSFALLCEVYLQYFSIYAFWLWMMTFTASSRPRTSLTSVSLPSRLL